MHKTTVEIDLAQLREAERNLGTQGFKETINRALTAINRLAALERAVRYLEQERESLPDWDWFRARRGRGG
jgi:hypothetical protein